jgi:hypothetical protein
LAGVSDAGQIDESYFTIALASFQMLASTNLS